MLLVSEPILGAEEKAALVAVIDSGWVTMGDRVEEFEQAFARLHQAEESVAVSSCTAALHLILYALGIGPGDEVLVPSLTFVATANSVRYVGARPVFVDIESPKVPLISLDEAEARCTARTKAVIIVHFGGYLAQRDAWQSFARRRNLLLIEDAAHAPGLPAAGTIGEAAAFSFYGNKNMTTAEGGAIIAHSRSLRETIRRARSHGMTSNTRQRLDSRSSDYDVTMLGFNYRMDELRAAVGLAQLKRLPEWNDIRRRLSLQYRRLIARLCPSVTVPFADPWPSAHHLMPVLLPTAISRQAIVDELRKRGVQTTVHYPPVHRLTFYKNLCPEFHLLRTEEFSRRELTLPLHPRMTPETVEFVVNSLAAALGAELSMEATA
ncbi:MAG: DegT/DnrJ/EryC1/StrS family aminotransferase [Bradyrhizobium sp.]|jgi:dTDP-4-amino-4,6-dideoxygalactose transaminase|uniref:DegT/DnrJ/EryC1/StrS family aminotransferase n=1 Tax=Bradyrhizobium sp. TaxID=376 RepID=UPI00120340CE|nr:DegT/DnrJ/EryC1/StrS family aminotransferase [Bradyrhizobium sp.]THD47450.1 MAG: DegT/DnrJ/EryC1/StrS family aminotransferase [Bradyrhizobium sp.]